MATMNNCILSLKQYLLHSKKILPTALTTTKKIDIVICTALIPGKKAPIIIKESMIKNMQPGSVIYDLAAVQGGNTAATKADEEVDFNGVKIMGENNILNKLESWKIILIIAGSVLFVIICIKLVMWLVIRNITNHNNLCLKISNPMVIMIGIGFYDENATNSEIKGHLRNLDDGTTMDIKKAVELFKDTFNYYL